MPLAPGPRLSKKRVPLYEEVAERLRQKIYDYELPPGEWIDEPALADEHVRLEQLTDRVLLRDLGGRDGTFVNGVALRNAVLHPGDQVVFAQHRFVLEAPGLPPRGSDVFAPAPRTGYTTQTMPAVQVPVEPASESAAATAAAEESRFNYGWLLLAAAAIALALVAILVYAPR